MQTTLTMLRLRYQVSTGVEGRRTNGHARVGSGTFPVIRTCLDNAQTLWERFWKNEKIMIFESQMSIFEVTHLNFLPI